MSRSPLRDSLAGQVLRGSGNVSYHLRECIGEGGQGWVFRANWDDPGGHVVIVKVLRPDIVQSDMLGRFQREAEVLRMLSTQGRPNPYIVRFYDHAVARVPAKPGDEPLVLPFTVLEFVDGKPLDKVLHDHGGRGLSVVRTRHLVRQICQALDAVHAQKIVHRDLKPSNILLATEAGTEIAKVTDFGLVKLVDISALQKTTMLAGASLGYAPPEQYEKGNKRVSPKTDLFALAAVVFEMLAGVPAFPFNDGENPLLIVTRILTAPRPTLLRAIATLAPELAASPPTVAALDKELSRALAADPKERHGSIMEFWNTIEPLLRAASDGPTLSMRECRVTPFEATLKLPSQPQLPALSRTLTWRWSRLGQDKPQGRLRAAAFSPSGTEAVAITAAGLFRWERSRWTPLPLPDTVAPSAVVGARYLANGDLIVFGERGLVAKVSRGGAATLLHVPDTSITFHGAFAEDSGLTTLVGARPYVGRDERTIPDPACGIVAQFSGDRLTLVGECPKVGTLRAVTRIASGRLVACGDFGALAVVELGVVDHIGFVCKGHLLAIAPLKTGGAVTVGAGGHALSLSPTLAAKLEPVQTTRDLVACATTEDGSAWATSVQGRLLRRPSGDNATWSRVTGELGLTTDIIAVSGNGGNLRAIGDDGTVVEGRSS